MISAPSVSRRQAAERLRPDEGFRRNRRRRRLRQRDVGAGPPVQIEGVEDGVALGRRRRDVLEFPCHVLLVEAFREEHHGFPSLDRAVLRDQVRQPLQRIPRGRVRGAHHVARVLHDDLAHRSGVLGTLGTLQRAIERAGDAGASGGRADV